MKKIMLLLLVVFLLPQLSFSQGSCHFSAQVYSQDPCCIIINAGCDEEDAWKVVVNGTDSYDYTDYDPTIGGPQILLCDLGTGSHLVEFYVNGSLWWDRTVTISDCETGDPEPGECHFSAQVYTQDPCCIIVNAGCENETAWTVVVDGTDTYDYTDYDPTIGGPQFVICYEENGVHTVEFFVNGELYWTRIVAISECGPNDPPGQCHFSAQVYSQDPCCIIVNTGCTDKTAWTVVVDGTTTYDFNDYDPGIGGPQFLICYEENGLHTVDFYVNGVLWWTRNVEITDCEDKEPCCGFEMDPPNVMIAPWDPCLVRLSPGNRRYDGTCSKHTFSWDIDGDGTIEHVGSVFITPFSGPGPHTVCVTMAYEDCEITDCVTFELRECEKGLSDGKGSQRSGIWDETANTAIELFPNPASDILNITLSENQWDPAQSISILDATGKVVQSQTTRDASQLQVDVSGLSLGVYFIQVNGSEGVITTERFVKIK